MRCLYSFCPGRQKKKQPNKANLKEKKTNKQIKQQQPNKQKQNKA